MMVGLLLSTQETMNFRFFNQEVALANHKKLLQLSFCSKSECTPSQRICPEIICKCYCVNRTADTELSLS